LGENACFLNAGNMDIGEERKTVFRLLLMKSARLARRALLANYPIVIIKKKTGRIK